MVEAKTYVLAADIIDLCIKLMMLGTPIIVFDIALDKYVYVSNRHIHVVSRKLSIY